MPSMTDLRRIAPIIVVAIFVAAAFGWTLTFDKVPPMLVRSFQPSAFPQMVCVFILICAVIAGINTIRLKEGNRLEDVTPEFYTTFAVMAVAGGVAMTLDFLLAMMVGAAGISFAWGERRASVLIGVGLVAPVLAFLLFNEALQIRFPRGVLLNIYYRW